MTERRPRHGGEPLSFDFALAPVARPVAVPVAPAVSPPAAAEPRVRAGSEVASGVRTPRSEGAAPAPKVPEREVWSVGDLGRRLGRTLDRAFAEPIAVEGEVNGARPHPSGHLYFALKDEAEEASIDVVNYRTSLTPRGRSLVRDGARIRVRGRPAFWAPRGRLQFVGDRVELSGAGALLEALAKRKAKLQAEGLFDVARKRRLPAEPRRIGVVTSRAGAVIHDICKVAFRRGGARILLAPASVQGAGAGDSIRRALRMLERVPDVDVVILARGGGSQEDLWTFHDEELVRAVANYPVPIVSAVGHETDVTLVDFAADARAATPSHAAELVVPDRRARLSLLGERAQRLERAIHARLAEERARTTQLAAEMSDARLVIATARQRMDEQTSRLTRRMTAIVSARRQSTSAIASRLSAAHPRARLAKDSAAVAALRARLGEHVRARVAHDRARLQTVVGRLDAMSPLKVLGRGYAIATDPRDGRAIRSAREIAVGDRVHVRVAEGTFDAEVTRTFQGDGEA